MDLLSIWTHSWFVFIRNHSAFSSLVYSDFQSNHNRFGSLNNLNSLSNCHTFWTFIWSSMISDLNSVLSINLDPLSIWTQNHYWNIYLFRLSADFYCSWREHLYTDKNWCKVRQMDWKCSCTFILTIMGKNCMLMGPTKKTTLISASTPAIDYRLRRFNSVKNSSFNDDLIKFSSGQILELYSFSERLNFMG